MQVKNSMQYCMSPNGILFSGMSGPDLSGRSLASIWQNFITKLTLLFVSSLFIAANDSWTKPSTFDVRPFFDASHEYSCSTMLTVFRSSTVSKNLSNSCIKFTFGPNSSRPSIIKSMSWVGVRQLNLPASEGEKFRLSAFALAEDWHGEPSTYFSTVRPTAASAASTVSYFFFKTTSTWRRTLGSVNTEFAMNEMITVYYI